MHMFRAQLLSLTVLASFLGVRRERTLALAVEGGGEVGTGGGSVGGLGEHGLEWGLPQKEQDGGCFSLGVTGGSIDQQCRKDVCAPKYGCDSFNLTTSVESGFLFDTVGTREDGAEYCLISGG
ncbi:unnamed protein product [Ectocarpus sp. CCAP 1310/34]|nr:unnamed protein product [Ectocarpus sp. CCAP 1310/34]